MRLFFIIGITFFVGITVGYLVWATPSTPAKEQEIGIQKLRGTVTDASPDTARYENREYGFSIAYPHALSVQEFDEGNGGMTIVFQSPERGFQIFITPYAEETISESRIRHDIPSGTIGNPTEVIIGNGIRALHFSSEAPIIGESTEVWFVTNGHLFQVTSYAALDSWIAEILTTLTLE